MTEPRTEAGKRLVEGTERDWNTPVLQALAQSVRQQVLAIEAEAAASVRAALEREHRINVPAHFLIAADHPARMECPTCAILDATEPRKEET